MMRRTVGLAAAAVLLALAGSARAECPYGRANSERDAGKYVTARASFVACARDESCGDKREECAKERDAVYRSISTIAFVVRDAAGRDLDAHLALDNDPTEVPLGRLVMLDPGIHEVRWTMRDGTRGTQKVTAVEGEKARTVIVLAVPVEAAPPAMQEKPQSQPARETTSSSSAWPWVLVATGTTLLVTSAVFQLVAINQDSERKAYEIDSTRSDLTASERGNLLESAQSKFDAAKTDQAIAITCGVLGGAAIASGFTWLLLRDRGTSVAATPTVGGVAVHGAF